MLLAFLGMSSCALGDEPSITLFSQVIEHRGDQVIRTGEFRYTLAILAPVTQEAIERRIAQVQPEARAVLEQVEISDELRAELEKDIEKLDQTIPDQMRANAGRRMQYYFALGGPELGGDRYVEFSVLDPESRLPGPTVVLLQRSLGAGKRVNLRCDERDRMAIVGNQSVSCGSQEPQRLGRANGLLLQSAAAIEASGDSARKQQLAEFDVETRKVDDADAENLQELVCKFRSGGTLICRVDPTRGFITPIVKELDAEGRVLRNWESEDYFQPADSDLWFPGTCKYQEYDYSEEGLEPRTEKYEFTKKSVFLNHEIPEDRFRVAVPVKIPLIDVRSGEQERYAATKPLTISLDQVDDIGAIPGLVAHTPNPARQPPETPLAAKERRLWRIAWSVLLLVAVIGLIFWKRRTTSTMPIVLFLVGLTSGCGMEVERTTEPLVRGGITVTPEKVEIGEVAIDRGEVDFSFQVANSSERDTPVRVVPSCGCTVVDEPEFIVPGMGSHEVKLSLALFGRSGQFDSKLRVICGDARSPDGSQEVLVPVHADLLDQWSTKPSRVVLARGGRSTVSISAPENSWEGIEMEPLNEGIEVTENSREILGALETRHYQIVAGPHPADSGIAFRARNNEKAFLVVPVLSR